jgi:CheY-like chemotaxis protein
MQPTPKAGRTTRLSGEEFLLNLSDSGLFPPDEVQQLRAGAAGGAHPADGDALAQQLVAAGKLTDYQAEAVRERRFTELRIGNYEVLQRLGAGGMGNVYKARHRRMKRIVALKVLSRSADQSGTFLQRFQREVELISRLAHPNIVMAFDADEAEVGHFLVMEFINGRDLAHEVHHRGPLPVREAVEAILQAARALEYAHDQGIIHRDVKPANLLRDASGTLKVADLGLARFNETANSPGISSVTQAGGIVGTVDYMPPEQAFEPSTVDHRADVYSLGCTFFFLLTGRPPYTGDSLMAILLKHREAPIASVATFRSDVPASVEAVFAKMVAKKPADRYQTMTEVVQALEGLDVGSAPASVAATLPVTPPAQPIAGDSGATVALGPASTSCHPKDLGVAQPPAAPKAQAVLLVEPSRTQASIIRKFLQELGATDIVVAPSGQKALEVLRSTAVRAVVSAMHLADMTGVQLLQQVRTDAHLAEVGFILVTSEADAPQTVGLREMPRTTLLPKPFDLEHLGQSLRQVAPA